MKIKMTIDHPYIRDYMESPLMLHKLKQECLQKRMALIDEGSANKNEFDKNEILLEKIKTNGELKALGRTIADCESYLIMYVQKELLPNIENMERELGDVIMRARKVAESNQEVKNMLSKVEFQPIGNINIDEKLYNFKTLKNLIK